MTQTLTTETLRALRDSLKSWQDGYDPVDDKEQYEMFVTAETAVGELLANREAQPVGFYTTVSGRGGVVWHNGAPEDDTAIYTAHPAPAVVNGRTAEGWMAEALLQKKIADGLRKSSPAVPPEKKLPELMMASYHEAIGWNACRAAMLAAGPESGNDPDTRR